jgi:hypothetical protein
MWFCESCQKEVVPYAVSRSAVPDDHLQKLRECIEKSGKLIVFNPPPVGKPACPKCQGPLR